MADRVLTVYVCGTDWLYEMDTDNPNLFPPDLYASVEQLKEKRTCWEECGIVELKIRLSKVILEGEGPGKISNYTKVTPV